MNVHQEVIRKNAADIIVYIVLGLLLSFFTNFGAGYYEKIVDSFAESKIDLNIIAVYSLILVMNCILGYIEQVPEQRIFHNVYYDYKLKALEKMSFISYEAYKEMGTGSLIQRIENGAEAGKKILCEFYLCIIRELLPSIVFSVYFIWTIDKRITYVILASYAVVFLVTNYLIKTLYKIKEKILVNEEKVNHFLVRGLMEMVIFRLYDYFINEKKKANSAKKEIVRCKVKMTMIHEAFFTIFAFLVVLIKIGLLLYGWLSRNISIGSIVALLALIDNAYIPIAIFNVLFVEYKLDKVSFERYQSFLSQKNDKRLIKGQWIQWIDFPIRLNSLEVSYKKRKVLRNVNLVIHKGEKIALVGESGAGKSTVIKILAGLLECGDHMVCFGKRQLNDMDLNSYFPHISYVPQDTAIFDGSVRENILFDADNENMLKNIKEKFALSSLFSQLEKGENTILGEKGIRLSGGEKQKIALARLWARDTELILLDEATSAMDNITEEQVIKTILESFPGKTIISVMHRLNRIMEFDRIIVFQNGEVVGDGCFQDLMRENAYFRRLYMSRSHRQESSVQSLKI